MKIFTHMRSMLFIVALFAFCIESTAQEQLLVRKSEISIRNGRAYYQGYTFTGIMLADGAGVKKIGEYVDGLKNGTFKEYFSNGSIKTEENYIYGVPDGRFNEWYQNGKQKEEVYYTEGNLTGKMTKWDDSGFIISVCDYDNDLKYGDYLLYFPGTNNLQTKEKYQNDLLDGVCEYYDINGNVALICQYEQGLKNGKYQEFFSNGKIKKEMRYSRNIMADGMIVEYDSTGSILKDIQILNNKIVKEVNHVNGEITSYYDYDNNKIESTGKLIDGLKTGFWIEWYPDGRKKFEGSYDSGVHDGYGVEYLKNGNGTWNTWKGFLNLPDSIKASWIVDGAQYYRGIYKNGKFDGAGLLFKDSIFYIGIWSNGQKNGYFREVNRDATEAYGTYKSDLQEGTWLCQYANGNKKSLQQYVQGKEADGLYQVWYYNGQLKEERTILNGDLNAVNRKWHDNGQEESAINYNQGKIVDGKYFYYDRSGNICKEETYQKNTLISEYSHSGKVKNGKFTEYYADGNKKISGTYRAGNRKVEERYGSNLKTVRFFRTLGSCTLATALVLGSLFVTSLLSTY